MRIPALAAIATAIAFSLAALSPALAQDKAPLTPEQEARIKDLVKEYILANPELILEAVQTLRKKQEEAQKKAAEEALKTKRAELQGATDLPVAGNAKGDVTIVEFMDYRCGYCKSVKPVLDEVMRADGKIRLVLKEFPILGPASRTASMAAVAANKQGKYLAFHNALMAYPNNLTDEVIFALARQVGLDVAKLKDDMKSPEVMALIEKTNKLAQDLGINGTPGFIIGDQIIPGAVTAAEMKERLAAARKACAEKKETLCYTIGRDRAPPGARSRRRPSFETRCRDRPEARSARRIDPAFLCDIGRAQSADHRPCRRHLHVGHGGAALYRRLLRPGRE